MAGFILIIAIIAVIIGVKLYLGGYKTPPTGMSKENKEKFNSDTGLGALIGIILVCVALAILGF